MWIKLFGAVSVMIAAWFIGKKLSDSLRIRNESLTLFDNALLMLETEMTYANNSIDRAFFNISRSIYLGGFFKNLSEQVQRTGARNAWSSELEKMKRELCLTDGDTQILLMLSAELGISNTENQIKSIRYCREMLKKAEEEAAERFKILSGLYRKLCMGGALMLVILFV